MDGLSKNAGVGPVIELGGEKYPVQPKILRHRGLIEAQIIKRRGNPFELLRSAAQAFSGDVATLAALMPDVIKGSKDWGTVTINEFAEFIETTWEGRVLTVWMAIKHNNPERLTVSHVEELFLDEYERLIRKEGHQAGESWWNEITTAIDQAGGEDEVGNSTGSQAEVENQATEESPGK